MNAYVCPHPLKRRFTTKDKAFAAAVTSGVIGLRPYACQCGRWHLTKKIAVAAQAETVETLLAAPEQEFLALVRVELVGKATPEEEGALRSDRLLRRWRWALDQLALQYHRELAALAGDYSDAARGWRRWNQDRVMRLATRRRELKELLRSLHARTAGAGAEGSAHGGKKPHATPANRAIDRLIDAHREEFMQLLAEEKERDAAAAAPPEHTT